MQNRWLIATLIGAFSTACDLPPAPTPEQRAAAEAREKADKARAEAEARLHQYVKGKQYLEAVNAILNDRLFEGEERATKIRGLLDSHAGTIEGAPPLDRFRDYGMLARLAKRANLADAVVRQYATSAFRAGASVDNPSTMAYAALLAREFDVELDGYWRAAARVWALRVDLSGWPDAEAQAFVTAFPLTGNLATTAFDAAMEAGRWKAARMIAERAQLSEQQFRAARAKEVEDLVAAAIQAQDDQRLLAISLEAPGFVDATVVKTVAARVVGKLLEEGKPMEAYGLAVVHGLDASDAKRAADVIFDRALKAGAFAIARQMPDGSFIIVERVPPPPVPPPAPSPTGSGTRSDSYGYP
jgi:hypothetical protein